MKHYLLFVLFLALLSCKNNENSKQTTAEKQLTDTIKKSTPETEEKVEKVETTVGPNSLIIHGKDIWVRDEPGIGKVVMKLNEGDICKILAKCSFEIIRGTADYWYKIAFKDETGYVFGSQTSKKSKDQAIEAESPDKLWLAFKKYHEDWCSIQEADPDGRSFSYSVDKSKEYANFSVIWDGEGPNTSSYTINPISTDDICFFHETDTQEGAMGFMNTFLSYVGMKTDGKFQLFPDASHAIVGKFLKLLKLSEKEYVLFTINDSGEEVVAIHSSSYNVTYINLAENSLRRINTEIGKVESFFDDVQEASVGDLLIKSSVIEFTDEYLSSDDYEEFVLKMFRSKKMTDNSESLVPFDTLETHYKWNDQEKRYTEE